MASIWHAKLSNKTRATITPYFGILPKFESDSPEEPAKGPPSWVWWLIAVLPLAERCKYKLLYCRQPEIRMTKLKDLLERILASEETLVDVLQC